MFTRINNIIRLISLDFYDPFQNFSEIIVLHSVFLAFKTVGFIESYHINYHPQNMSLYSGVLP